MVIAILTCVILSLFGVMAFIVAQQEKAERKELEAEKRQIEKEKQEAIDRAKQKEQATNEAIKTKNEAKTGNVNDDFNYIVNKLHEFAK